MAPLQEQDWHKGRNHYRAVGNITWELGSCLCSPALTEKEMRVISSPTSHDSQLCSVSKEAASKIIHSLIGALEWGLHCGGEP